MPRQKNLGGAPQLAPLQGEPDSPPSGGDAVSAYGGAPTIGVVGKGERAQNPTPESEIFPATYGSPGTEKVQMTTRPDMKKRRGSGDKTGAGQTSSPS